MVKRMNAKFWKSGFPFFCDIDNHERHDSWDAMARHYIYRDAWERHVPDEKPPPRVQDCFNYPEDQALMEAVMYYPVPESGISTNMENPIPWDLSVSEAEIQNAQKEREDSELAKQSTVLGKRAESQSGGTGPSAPTAGGQPENYIGYFDGKKFHYADPDFDIEERIRQVEIEFQQQTDPEPEPGEEDGGSQ